jgi:Mrp family chromosome partitioning ATPase/capsular polysaccharide biosynthesis protein
MNDTTDAAAIFAPLWKRKWMILIVGLLVGAVSYAYYKRQPSVYSASTQLNLASGFEEQALGGGKAGAVTKAGLSNAAALITSAQNAEEAHKLLKAGKANGAKGSAKGKVRAKTSATGSDIVTITCEAKGAKKAAACANAYALAYIKHQHTVYVRSVRTAIAQTRAQLRRIELAALSGKGKSKSGGGNSGTAIIQAASLNTKLNQLESQLAVQGVQQISPAKAKGAELVEPQPKKNAIFGFAFGVVLAAIAAFVAERFDRSLRSMRTVESIFGTHVLTALPSARHPIVEKDGPRPARALLEPLRRLQTTLHLRESPVAEGNGEPRVILCTSANSGDGKSTLVAGLALVKRDAGERVAVVEADFTRPVMARLLAVSAEAGLADALTGRRPLDAVIQTAPLAGQPPHSAPPESPGDAATLVQTRTTGSVSVLVGGTSDGRPPSLADRNFADLIASLAMEYDSVLIDAPSPLDASEAMPLLGVADGIVVIARLNHTQDVSAARLAELLELPSTAPVLGAVANDVPIRELRRSGFTARYNRRRGPRLPTRK